MAANVYIQKEDVDHVRVKNDTGSDVSQYDFEVVGPYAAVADEDVSNTEVGSFHVEEGIQLQSDTLESGEDTFGTEGQSVYWNPTALTFSDTSTAGYYLVGYLVRTKDSNGMIVFEKLRYAELVAS